MDQKPTLRSRLKHCWDWLGSCFRSNVTEHRDTMFPDGDPAQVKQNGWRQGSIVDDDLVDELTKSSLLPRSDAEGIYLLVSDEELDHGHDYEVVIWAAMTVEDHADPENRETATKLLNTIESELDACEGIAIELAELRSEATIGLSDIRIMKRWDYYNDLTLREDDQDAIPRNG